jgi:hypothetical protein
VNSVVEKAQRLVVKVGSGLVTGDGRGLDLDALSRWAGEIAQLRQGGRQVVLVSSGAIAAGMQRLGWERRPHALHELQAAAAVGQMGLIQAYETCFRGHRLLTSQVLLTHDDLADRKRPRRAATSLDGRDKPDHDKGRVIRTGPRHEHASAEVVSGAPSISVSRWFVGSSRGGRLAPTTAL